MALYRPDYRLREAKEIIDALDTSIKEYELIDYYIKKKEERIKRLEAEVKEYNEWFKQLDRFLPNKNPIFK
jgi:predicted RNase H-like nuclease (RuvC/YqgF family)